MMALLLAAWRAGGIAKFAEIAGVLGLVFLAGMAFGNVRATRHALEAVQARADSEFALMTNRLAEDVKVANIKIKENAEQGRKADDGAIATLRSASGKAAQEREAALAQLTKERALRPIAKEIVNASCPQPKPFMWSGDARLVLDRAAGAVARRDSGHRDPFAETAGGIVGGAPAATSSSPPASGGY
jgi:hypothetical protein